MEKNRKVDFPVQEQKRKAFASRLKTAMRGKFTQETLAEEIGFSVSGIKKWFSGTTDPSWSAIIQVALACNVSLDWLAFGTEPQSDRANEAVDEEVLLAAIQAVETDLHDRGETMEPSDKSRLIYLLYRTRMKEKDQSLTEPKSVMSSLLGKSRNGRTGRNNTTDEYLEIPQRQRSRRQGTDE
ncbi:helix-turn-helix domain-containing protein [Thalassospira sp. MIT1370]|uniref:helix-turn-helix domain-containing protein n=1 Tax=unclassified Thalassospira TaxID=2648997 RepID=UPI00399AE29C